MVSCRNCRGDALDTFIDLGSSPLSNGYLDNEGLLKPEMWFPLSVQICTNCWLAQTRDFVGSTDVFTADYAYFSSMSSSWIEHSRKYVEAVAIQLQLNPTSFVIEVAANDGYLLQFVRRLGIPCLGIEPTNSTAAAARNLGLEILEDFLTTKLAEHINLEYGKADLVIANNVMAHVPDIKDFASSLFKLLKADGVLTTEFPRLSTLIDGAQFDTIYHEHFSYLSLQSVSDIFRRAGLRVFDVEEIPTHGGSYRVYAQPTDSGLREIRPSVDALLEFERNNGLLTLDYYRQLQGSANRIKHGLLDFLLHAMKRGQTVGAYGAAAKGNTLLNFAGVKSDLLPYVVDKSPGKVGRYLPGSRIPILAVEELYHRKPDLILILPWNIASEVSAELQLAQEWGARLFTPIPEIREMSFPA